MKYKYNEKTIEKLLQDKRKRRGIQRDVTEFINNFEKNKISRYTRLAQERSWKCYKASNYDVRGFIEKNAPKEFYSELEKIFCEGEYNIFSDFCEMQFNIYREWEEENGLKDFRLNYRQYSDSRFYIISDPDFFKYSAMDLKTDTATECAITNLFIEAITGQYILCVNNILDDYFVKIDFKDEDSDYYEDIYYYYELLDFIFNDFEKELNRYFEDELKIMDYFDYFFNNEVEIYEEHLQCELEWRLKELEKEKAQEKYDDELNCIYENYKDNPVQMIKEYTAYIQFEDQEKLTSDVTLSTVRSILSDIDFLKHANIITEDNYNELKSLSEQ